jgi:CDP-glucose 4,6-dehydratase
MPYSLADFYRGKRVLVTGHTGFEGGWTAACLKQMGAQVCGYGLPPASRPNFFDAAVLDRGMTSTFGDIRDRNALASTFTEIQPEIVIHCAAWTSPQISMQEPVEAFSTNVMGTVHILEEARLTQSVRAVVLVSGESDIYPQPQSRRKSGREAQSELGQSSVLSAEQALAWTIEWYRGFYANPSSALGTTEDQLERYARIAAGM